MSLFPVIFREMIRPMRIMEHQMRVMQEELMNPRIFPASFFNQKLRCPSLKPEDISSVISDKEKFQVKMDVQHFKPEEITVKISENNTVVIEAKHEEKTDEKGFISRQIIRRFIIPEGHDFKQIASSLSSDGILTITAPKNPESGEKIIPITRTGPERVEEKKTEEIELKNKL